VPYLYKYVLVVLAFALPFFIISRKNPFDRATRTALRFGAAVLVVWAYIILVRVIVTFVDPLLASTPEQIEAASASGTGKNAFAWVFGWAYGLVAATISWLLARAWWWLRSKRATT
jgi:hypothetical protein